MADWYYKSMGAEVGPLTNKELLEKVRKGEVTPETEVRKDDSRWHSASRVDGLFEQAQRPGTEQVCPYCGHLVARPPAKCENCSRWVTAAVEREKGQKESSHENISQALAGPGEDFEYDEGSAQYALLSFAFFFVGAFFLFVYMVISSSWSSGFWSCLIVFTILCLASIATGLWLRHRSRKPAVRR